jgi:hypothetical protein
MKEARVVIMGGESGHASGKNGRQQRADGADSREQTEQTRLAELETGSTRCDARNGFGLAPAYQPRHGAVRHTKSSGAASYLGGHWLASAHAQLGRSLPRLRILSASMQLPSCGFQAGRQLPLLSLLGLELCGQTETCSSRPAARS